MELYDRLMEYLAKHDYSKISDRTEEQQLLWDATTQIGGYLSQQRRLKELLEPLTQIQEQIAKEILLYE